jgi:hypothetical protein
MSYFLLVYDRSTGVLHELTEFRDEDRSAARRARLDQELRQRDHADVEVVLLGARSKEDLLKTHARYFRSVPELIADAM